VLEKMAKKKPVTVSLDVNQRMRRVKILQETNRTKEAIAYIFLTFTDVLKEKYGPKVWKPSLTMQELAIRLVKARQVRMDPEKIYPFISHLERVLYGGEPATDAKLEETKQYFQNIYNVIKSSESSTVTETEAK
jgi:hypothetical protein